MARRVRIVAPELLRARIAHAVLGGESAQATLGTITLHDHQRVAAARLETMIAEHGGAVLADAVGVGKTFVALAVARGYERTLVVAPAVLRGTWTDSACRAGCAVEFHSTESLSRGTEPRSAPDFVIVDEAHHFRNPRTRRHATLARIVARKPVLFLTATPVHNRSDDVTSLLRLFVDDYGAAAELHRFVVRREHSDLDGLIALPELEDPVTIEIPAPTGLVASVRSLPAPVPTRDGSIARALLATSLLHQIASSAAAFRSAVRRRIAAGEAMVRCLESGALPSAAELTAWTSTGDDVQLAFPELVVAPDVAATPELHDAIRAHTEALRAILGLVDASDQRRAQLLAGILAAHDSAIVVAFAQYRATVDALYAALARVPGVAKITGRAARIASGPITRDELVSMVKRDAPPARRVRLLLTTDILSEGVNLTDAAVVVHLDLPWTAARMEQRTGRCRRLGSTHRRVIHYLFTPPAELDRALRASRALLRKAALARNTIGSVAVGPRADRSDVRYAELVRAGLTSWLRDRLDADDGCLWVAASRAPRAGYLALVASSRDCHLLTKRGAAPRAVHGLLGDCSGAAATFGRAEYVRARRAVERWMRDRAARGALGLRTLSRAQSADLRRMEAHVVATAIHTRARAAAQIASARKAVPARDTGLRLRALLLLVPATDTDGTRGRCDRARGRGR